LLRTRKWWNNPLPRGFVMSVIDEFTEFEREYDGLDLDNRKRLRYSGFDPSRFEVLTEVLQSDEYMKTKKIVEETGFSNNTVLKYLRRMVEEDLVEEIKDLDRSNRSYQWRLNYELD